MYRPAGYAMTGEPSRTGGGDTVSPPQKLAGELRPYPKYKESKLPWLEKIPKHWTEERAKYFFREVDERSKTGDEELLSVSHVTGVTPRSQKNITMFKAESYAGYKLCNPHDLVINTMWAWMGALGVSKYSGIVSSGYGVYRPLDEQELLSEYVDSLLRTDPYKSEYYCRSTGIRPSRFRLYPEQFLRMPLICPPHEEQEKMMAFLQMKDMQIKRYIRTKRQLIGVLNEQKQVIINHAITRGIDPNVRLKPSGIEWLGDVPEHWDIMPLKRIAWFKSGAGFPVNDQGHNDLEIPFLKVSDMTILGNDLRMNGFNNSVSRETAQKLDAYIFPTNTIIFPKVGGAMLTNKRRILTRPSCIDNNNMGCVIQKGDLDFLFIVMKKIDLGKHANPGPVPAIGDEEVREIKIAIPPQKEQIKIVSWIKTNTSILDSVVGAAQKEIDLIQEYRTRLIADVVTGKLDVRNVEIVDEAPVVDDLVDPIDELDDNVDDDNHDDNDDDENDM